MPTRLALKKGDNYEDVIKLSVLFQKREPQRDPETVFLFGVPRVSRIHNKGEAFILLLPTVPKKGSPFV